MLLLNLLSNENGGNTSDIEVPGDEGVPLSNSPKHSMYLYCNFRMLHVQTCTG